jgi:hypothetical protein
MDFVVRINTDNAAFEGGNRRPEIARILREIAVRVEQTAGGLNGKALDINGNTTAKWELQ